MTNFVLRMRKGVPGVGSRLAKALGLYEATCGFRPHYKVTKDSWIINYGRSETPIWWEDCDPMRFLNIPQSVSKAVNKLSTLNVLHNYFREKIPCLEFTDKREEALSWLSEGHGVFIRHELCGKKGNGIQIVYPNEYSIQEFPEAPLYTKAFPKEKEFRVHIVDGKVVDYVQKKKMTTQTLNERNIEYDPEIRNHKRGWVFAHKDIEIRQDVCNIALKSVEALGLDFAGVDVLALKNSSTCPAVDRAVVCEVNTAPGMSSPTTFNAYVKAFNEIIN